VEEDDMLPYMSAACFKLWILRSKMAG
ncbi:hypothetical protein PPOP_3431, partial [Paenibacillus popilliae ATCC 14706]